VTKYHEEILTMIRGIGGKPYINLDPYLDIEGFIKLHYKICKGIALSIYKKEGNIVRPGGYNLEYAKPFKPVFLALEEYHNLPEDHEIRIMGREIGEYDNRDKFVLFLKLALGAYDPYQFIFLKTEGGTWASRFEEKAWTPDIELFPELKVWLENLVTSNVLKHLGRVIIFKAEHDSLTHFHRDLIMPDETDYFNHRHEFIHIRTRLDRDFCIWDEDTDTKILATPHAIFFNDQDWHNGGRCVKQTFSIRIDGEFTEEFRNNAGFGYLAHY
jgi:hypothetical protein